MTLIQFDTKITDITVFEEKDKFEKLVVIGRGGTSFVPVRQWIIDNTPTAAIVFSDMGCEPMEPLPVQIPIVWIAINNRGSKVPFGTLIHIKG
jgi:predicted metal-dependent peptidase